MAKKYTREDAARLHKVIESTINGWWAKVSKDTYDMAQNDSEGFVPYQTGKLQRSGYLNDKDGIDGFSIGYSAPYAGKVYGSKQGVSRLAEPYVMDCPPYFRKGSFVRGHTKTFHKLGEKPAYIKKAGGWRTVNVNTTKALRKPNEWIQRAWEVIYTQIHPKDIKVLGIKKRIPAQFPARVS